MKYIMLRNNTYHYRRRISRELIPYFDTKTFYKSLSENKAIALHLASEISMEFSKAVALVKLGLKPTIDRLLNQQKQIQTVQEKPRYKSFLEVSKIFLQNQDISKRRYSELEKYFEIISKLLCKNVTQNNLDQFRVNISKLPKGNIQKYKKYSISELTRKDVPKEDRLSIKTKNEYIKALNAVLTFGSNRDYFDKAYKVKTFKQDVAQKNQRKALN